MKKCKFCDGNIHDEAIKCNHCWEFQEVKYKWKWVQVKPRLFQRTFCTHCHHEWTPKSKTQWSLLVEILLWMLMIIPWLFYSIWRQKSKYCVCAKCGSDQINRI